MNKPISATLRGLFVTHAIVSLVIGLGYLFIPDTLSDWFSYPFAAGPIMQVLGAAILGYGLTSVLGAMAYSWEHVRIVIQGEMLWTLVAAAINLWFLVDGTLPTAFWAYFGLLAFFFLGFGYCYWQEETAPQPRTA